MPADIAPATRAPAPARPAPAPPRTETALLGALRRDLAAAPFTTQACRDLLGPLAHDALDRENPIPARRVLAEDERPTAVLLWLFTLGGALRRDLVERALPSLGLEGALALGLVEEIEERANDEFSAVRGTDGENERSDGAARVRALIDLSPYAASDDRGEIQWWIASDLSEIATGAPLASDHVLGVGGASLTLARITPREHVGRVLDLGCGGGIQALHASRHADHVVATDLSPRALAFAAFNAALNGIELELREGSLLEPVAGEQFDLVVSNPPFVITPRSGGVAQWTYRDGGRTGDVLTAELLADLPPHLAPGGIALMLSNWEISADTSWDVHPRAWLEPVLADGIDAWVIQRESEDAAQYAETWARDGGITVRDAAWTSMQEAWLDDFEARGTTGIGFGYLMLRRPDAPRPDGAQVLLEEVTGTGSGTLSEHIGAGLAALDGLARLDDEALLASRPVRAADVVERRHLTPGEFDPMLIELVQGGGFARSVREDQVLAAVVGALEGTLTLGQVLGAVCALTDEDEDSARERVLPQLREMIRTSMVTL
jgi:methylase of polypeptide subunit release factors